MAQSIPKMRLSLSHAFSFLRNVCIRKNLQSQHPNIGHSIRWNSSSKPKPQWQMMSAICVERKPLLTQIPKDIENRFSNLLSQLELEQSLKSDHEMRHQEDVVRADKLKRGDVEDSEIEATVMQTAQDLEDAGVEELQQFPISKRITEADEINDQTSLQRALDTYLVLVVRQKLGSDARWILPQGAWQQGETMRQTAERVLRSTCGDKIRVTFLGNAPCGFYKYKFPRQMWGEGKPTGAKVFFFKARYVDGELMIPDKEIEEFKWLKQDEMKEIFRPSYFDAVSGFLVDADSKTKSASKDSEDSKSKIEIEN